MLNPAMVSHLGNGRSRGRTMGDMRNSNMVIMASLVVGVGGLGYWLVMKFQVELYGFGLSPILWSTGCNTNMMCQFCLCPIQCFSLT
jgi:hypothetical protein